jgi:tryptophan synthase alpha chain
VSASPGARIAKRFAALAADGRAGLVTFVTAGDPDRKTAAAILDGLPKAGADVIELGMPFSDPMADGPVIQASSLRALRAGQKMATTLDAVRRFRTRDPDTPVVLMGYYNPIYRYGDARFSQDAASAGVDGLIVVDLPPEEEGELRPHATEAGLSLIRLVSPNTSDARIAALMKGTSGFVYHVSITGITGTRSAEASGVAKVVRRIRAATSLPVAVGFGIRTPEQAAEIARVADAAVVGSAIVQKIADGLDAGGRARPDTATSVLDYVSELARGVRAARNDEARAAGRGAHT